ncbi:sugar MFS transporter [Roseivirga sp. BDSF3-8]|uniref:MFS transporter n=1 Tax=Roseivirga sp. BDSF3-8 TaxID=3241598 RepID=UPI003531B97F
MAKKNILLLICFIAFISLGLPDGLLGVGWPYMHQQFDVGLDSLGLLLICLMTGYLISSFNSGWLMARMSVGALLAISCALTGISLLGFAYTPHWGVLLIMAVVLGAGGGAIDSSINTFAAHTYTAGTVNWLHAFFGVGATLGPAIMTAYLVRDYHWSSGYLTVGSAQLGLAAIFLLTLGLWKTKDDTDEPVMSARPAQTLRLPVTWISVIVFFLYTGTEASVGQWLYTILTKGRGVAPSEAGLWTSIYWGSLTAGRIIFGIILRRMSVGKILMGAFVAVVLAAVLIAINAGALTTSIGIIIAGLALAPVFPSMISLTPSRAGRQHAANLVGYQVSAATVGAALLPAAAGLVIDRFGLNFIPVVQTIQAVLLLLFYLLLVFRYRLVR